MGPVRLAPSGVSRGRCPHRVRTVRPLQVKWHKAGEVLWRPVETEFTGEKVSLVCCIDRVRLVDPARANGCKHASLCNYTALRKYVSRCE